MNLSQKGFTLTELIIIVGIVAALAAIALPNIIGMLSSSTYKEAARGIRSTLQDARAQSVALNLEHRVAFDVDQNRYRLERGNSSSGSTTWTPVVSGWTIFKPGIVMRGTLACDSDADRTIHFNPNGTAQTVYICVMDNNLIEKYKVGVASTTTGRVVTIP